MSCRWTRHAASPRAETSSVSAISASITWTEHGEALMRRRKERYYRRKPRPGVSVIGDRLLELAFGGRR